jgi:hypothetical protein
MRPFHPIRGADRDRHERGMECDGRGSARQACETNADGEAVWSRFPDAGIKPADGDWRATVAKKPGHRGERGISLQPLRRGCRLFG